MPSPAPSTLPSDAKPVALEPDPELLALPDPPRQERHFTVLLMVVTLAASCALLWALRGEVRYAISPASPMDLGELAQATPTGELANRYVRASGLLSGVGAIRYERPMEGDSFRLAPIAANANVWVEIRVPEGMEGAKFAPPTTFVGRLVPLRTAGIRHAGLAQSVQRAGLTPVPQGAWLLVDGASPRASRWAIALVAFFGYFAVWNAIGLFRILRKVRDRAVRLSKEKESECRRAHRTEKRSAKHALAFPLAFLSCAGCSRARAMAITYREAGVDINAGDALVERIKPWAKATRTPFVLADVGGFAGLCGLPPGLHEPVLVSGTDGVGTKLKIAFLTGKHDTIGQDLVAMCVNDIVTTGAVPLFFLDYFATGKLTLQTAEAVIAGVATACKEAGCALLGGETAEMPGMYAEGEYDLAGFAVGVVERAEMLDGKRVRAGDVVLGLASTGLHSNGYSLARRVLLEERKMRLEAFVAELGATLADALLAPTRIYANAVRAALESHQGSVHAIAHITGGGIPGNIPRVLPEGLGVRLQSANWKRPALFDIIAKSGPVEEEEMRRAFNLGLGLALVVAQAGVDDVQGRLITAGEAPFVVGEVIAIDPATPFDERVVWA